MKDKIKDELWNLHRKADQTRSIHGMIKNQYDLLNRYSLLFITIGSAITSMLIFAKLSTEHQFYVGILSAILFIISLLPSTLKYDNKIEEHNLSINLLSGWIRDVSSFCNTEIDQLNDQQADQKKNDLLNQYKDIIAKTPNIPDYLFNKGKQKHLQKVEISKELSKNPFKKICTIKKELKNRIK